MIGQKDHALFEMRDCRSDPATNGTPVGTSRPYDNQFLSCEFAVDIFDSQRDFVIHIGT